MITEDLADALLTRAPGSTWSWATVTQATPLRIRLDGQTTAQDLTPVTLVPGLRVGHRVWVQIAGRRLVVLGSPQAGPRGSLAVVELLAQETSTSTTTYAEIAGLSLPSVTVTSTAEARRIRVTVNTVVSITGGPARVLGRVRTGPSAVVCANRTLEIPTNGNSPLNMTGTIDLPPANHNFSFQIAPEPGGVTVRARGDLAKCSLVVEDIGAA